MLDTELADPASSWWACRRQIDDPGLIPEDPVLRFAPSGVSYDGAKLKVERTAGPATSSSCARPAPSSATACARRSTSGATSRRTRSASAPISPTARSTSPGAGAEPACPCEVRCPSRFARWGSGWREPLLVLSELAGRAKRLQEGEQPGERDGRAVGLGLQGERGPTELRGHRDLPV